MTLKSLPRSSDRIPNVIFVAVIALAAWGAVDIVWLAFHGGCR